MNETTIRIDAGTRTTHEPKDCMQPKDLCCAQKAELVANVASLLRTF